MLRLLECFPYMYISFVYFKATRPRDHHLVRTSEDQLAIPAMTSMPVIDQETSAPLSTSQQKDGSMKPDESEEDGTEQGYTTLVSNGCIDSRGKIADKRKTGGWKASPYIIVNEVTERLAFYAIAVNMVSYLVLEMHQSLPNAAIHATNWIGAAFVLTILGAFVADAYWGRFKTIMVFSSIYAVGMVLLMISATKDSLRPPPCIPGAPNCIPATKGQEAFLYCALVLIALGTGGIKPCVSSFGADQFDEADVKEVPKKYSFFNWFFFAINMGSLLGITVLVYVQTKMGWGWGFGIPTALMISSVIILGCGFRFYRYQRPMGSAFTRFFQVVSACTKNHLRGIKVQKDSVLYEVNTEESDIFGAQKLTRTSQYRFLDKAAVITNNYTVYTEDTPRNRWNLCTVTQVEEFKSFIRVLPIWASTIALSISYAQLSTFFISQAFIMNRQLGPNFLIPTGSVPVFSAVNALVLIPIYEGWMVPFLRRRTGHRRGITSLQRMGVGLFVSIFAMAYAAVFEKQRREHHPKPLSMSVFWLFPQYFLIGSAEVFTYVGQLEFFYDEATHGTRSISSAIFLSEIGIGSWLSTVLVKTIVKATGGEQKGWLRNNLNQSRLDYFYWVLTGINMVNFLIYVFVALRYKGRDDGGSSTVSDEAVVELQGETNGEV